MVKKDISFQKIFTLNTKTSGQHIFTAIPWVDSCFCVPWRFFLNIITCNFSSDIISHFHGPGKSIERFNSRFSVKIPLVWLLAPLTWNHQWVWYWVICFNWQFQSLTHCLRWVAGPLAAKKSKKHNVSRVSLKQYLAMTKKTFSCCTLVCQANTTVDSNHIWIAKLWSLLKNSQEKQVGA